VAHAVADAGKSLVKIVYFDEQSASDYLDITAGGKETSSREEINKRFSEMHAKVEASVAAKFSWLPFLGASAATGGGTSAGRDGQSILSKTLSNTILTDYLEKVEGDPRVARLEGLRVYAATSSLAYMKTFTPYLIIARTEEQGIDLAKLDEALTGAKGYYEMVGADAKGEAICILRFNFHAFRNNYGLIDVARMQLTYHGVLVGETAVADLTMESEMGGTPKAKEKEVAELFDDEPVTAPGPLLPVFDILLAGVEYG
jgi:hypothetical protein